MVELFERLTTLGIAVNLVTYLTGTMHLGNAAAANTVTNFLGTCFMLCLLGGFIADTFLGRYATHSTFSTPISFPPLLNKTQIQLHLAIHRYLTVAIFATVEATVRTMNIYIYLHILNLYVHITRLNIYIFIRSNLVFVDLGRG